MKIKILSFGILKDLIGKNSLELILGTDTTIKSLKGILLEKYPKIIAFSNFSIAVNEEYVDVDYVLKSNDVVALIPPVSGG